MKHQNLIICALFSLLLSTQVLAQKPAKSEVLLQFPSKKEEVTKAEFERVYQKNNGGYEAAAKHTQQQYKDYLDLYINFKRKVFEAEELGLDKTPAFQTEYAQYKKQLAQPYMGAKEAEDKLIQEAYERSLSSINAAHLLIMVDENASAEDTLLAYNKCLAYRDSIVKFGKSFDYIAATYSQDPSAKENKGSLGYFNVFDMVYPFESAAYNTPVGQVSMPVRTRFGYHLVKVNDKVKNEGTKRLAHIIIRVGDRYSAKDSAQAVSKINEIYEKLKAGGNFSDLARQYSDDPNTALKGGDLGSARLRPELEERKMKLGLNQFSEPFQTTFGWHILKVTEVSGAATMEAAKPDLKRKIEKDSRSQLSRQMLLERIRKENKVEINQNNFDLFKNKLSGEFPKGVWGKKDYKDSADFKLELFKISDAGGKVLTQGTINDFADYCMKEKMKLRAFSKLTSPQAADGILAKFMDERLVQLEEDRLPEKNPDYKALLKEYRDGILLFSLMEQKVWKKAVDDTTGLRKFYDANKEGFKADEMIDAKEYRTMDKEVIMMVEQYLREGKSDKFIDSLINNQSSLKLRITTQTFEKGKNEVANALFGKSIGFRSENVKDGDFYKIFVIEKTYPAGIKPFEKAKSECITKYQDFLEKEWLAALATKYPVKIKDKVLPNLYK
jgi:peptidyl-prolyl cis-trans isomerase SurA